MSHPNTATAADPHIYVASRPSLSEHGPICRKRCMQMASLPWRSLVVAGCGPNDLRQHCTSRLSPHKMSTSDWTFLGQNRGIARVPRPLLPCEALSEARPYPSRRWHWHVCLCPVDISSSVRSLLGQGGI